MFFEEEKLNIQDDTQNEFDFDLDSDDGKAITWDDLLSDDGDLDLDSVKKASDAQMASEFDDLDISGSDDMFAEPEEIPAPVNRDRNVVYDNPTQDAFDVFGGEDVASTAGTELGEAVDIDDMHKTIAMRKAANNAAPESIDSDDDYHFDPNKAMKKSSVVPALVGVFAAFVIAGLGVFAFLNKDKFASNADYNSLSTTQTQQGVAPSPDTSATAGVPTPGLEPDAAATTVSADKSAASTVLDNEAKKNEAVTRKMVVLPVQTGGRVNPFAPNEKFNQSAFANSNIDLLAPPEELADLSANEDVKKLMGITVSGILFDSAKPSAILNMSGSDYFVQKGDKIDEYQVLDITSSYVAIRSGQNVYKATVGQGFNSNPSGMAVRQGGGFGGSRQYTAVSDVDVNVKDGSTSGY